MKRKLLLSAWALLALMTAAFSQKSFQTGSNVLSAGVGVAGIKWPGTSFNAIYEYGVTDNLGAGAHFGYSKYKKNGYTYTAYLFGVRGSYHFANTEKVDPYAGAELGFASISHTGFNESVSYKSYPKVGVGLYGGVRYYVNPGMGVYGELRLSAFAVVNAGLCFKF